MQSYNICPIWRRALCAELSQLVVSATFDIFNTVAWLVGNIIMPGACNIICSYLQ